MVRLAVVTACRGCGWTPPDGAAAAQADRAADRHAAPGHPVVITVKGRKRRA